MTGEISTCRRIAPDDLRPGMFVAVMGVVHEVFPTGAFDAPEIRPPRAVRVVCTGCSDGEPLRIICICIPFVQLEDARGELRTLDIRQQILAELAEDFGLEAFTRPRRKCDDD